jgi:Phosphotransferase enzyme family
VRATDPEVRPPVARTKENRLGAEGVEPERGYGWLGAVIPADARRFKVADAALATVLSDAGAQLVAEEPDVEIAPVRELRGAAALSISVLGHPARAGRPFPVRVVRRLVNSLRVRLGARRARRIVRRLGYATVRILMWDHEMVLRGATRGGVLSRSRLIEYLPQRALVIGGGSRPARTLLDEVLDEASRVTGVALKASPPSVRAELLIIDTVAGVVRIAVGPGRRQILNQRSALAILRANHAPAVVAERVPWELASGMCGMAEWSLESKLPGARPSPSIGGHLLADCMDFLAALHSVCPSNAEENTLLEQAEVVVDTCPPEQAHVVRALAERLEAALADLPRGFGHGDFFHGNLLVDGGRLVGVVDWDAAGPCRLPLLDLLHLRLMSIREVADVDWGPSLLRHLVPWARTGGGDLVRSYCQRAGLTVDPKQLEALVLAYWLDYVSYQLRTHLHRLAQPPWIERNIQLVLRVVGADTPV